MKILQSNYSGELWRAELVCGDNDYNPNIAVGCPGHRRAALTEDQIHTLGKLPDYTNLTARAIKETALVQYRDVILIEKDVPNLRRKLKKVLQGGTSA